MPEFLAAALATQGLIWLVAAAFAAGVVRGFAGFGTAMIYLPVAGQILTPFEALTTLVIMDVIGPLPVIPRALRDGVPGVVGRLMVGLVIALPIGVYLLTKVAPEVFRYGVSSVTLVLLVLLITGVRYSGAFSRRMVISAGALSGFLAGSVGLPGPPVIMLHMASEFPPKVIRANLMLYLLLADIVMLAVFWAFGQLVLWAIGLGLVVALPYLLGNLTGARIFRPSAEKLYRFVAYAIIATSALSGLPVFD